MTSTDPTPKRLTDDELAREVAAVAQLALALLIDSEPWLPSDDPKRVEWLARQREYSARKDTVLAHIEATR